MNGKKEFGDYQTPKLFAGTICNLLSKKYTSKPQIVIEPTCGVGNFLHESLIFKASLYYGIDINRDYCDSCRKTFTGFPNVTIYNDNIYSFDLKSLINVNEEILIIGNPPWITNSELSKNNSFNLPIKTNCKSFNGFNALTGASNFDVCEYIILSIIEAVKNRKALVSMLCKTSVARNIFAEINRRNICYTAFDLYKFNAKKIFNVSTAACLLVIDFRNCTTTHLPCCVFNIDTPFDNNQSFAYSEQGIIVQNCTEDFYGKCCFEWRQGVKHDCSKIMELKKSEHHYINGLGDELNIEDTYVFPLIKSSMLKKPVINSFWKYVIVTQRKIKENTDKIYNIAPRTWHYLSEHRQQFDNRKSSIYKNTPVFSMFGIGDYTFAPYKVAVSGFYKVPMFSLIYSDNTPVMCDDTSYFLAFSDYDQAYTAMLILNNRKVRNFLQTISAPDSKRPYTKQLLNRLDIKKILASVDFYDIIETEKQCNLPPHLTLTVFQQFKEMIYASSISE